jgi:hypothetical protein
VRAADGTCGVQIPSKMPSLGKKKGKKGKEARESSSGAEMAAIEDEDDIPEGVPGSVFQGWVAFGGTRKAAEKLQPPPSKYAPATIRMDGGGGWMGERMRGR